MSALDAAREAGRREAERAGPITKVAAIELIAEILRASIDEFGQEEEEEGESLDATRKA